MINNRHSLFVAVLALFCAACGSDDGSVPSSTYYDSTSPRTERQRVGKPYQIKGQWYTPKYETDYDETGLASWYGDYFHGRSTSNGEKFDMNKISAAHKTLPLPSYVEVTNLDNGRKLYVRVNDRGPFVDDRIIDLSKKAAELLGSKATGLARVRVRQVDPPKNVVLLAPDGSKIYGKGYKYPSAPTTDTMIASNNAKKSSVINDMPLSKQSTPTTQVALYDRNLFPTDRQSFTPQTPVTVPQIVSTPVASPVQIVSNQPVANPIMKQPVTIAQPSNSQPNPDIVANILKEHNNSMVYGNTPQVATPQKLAMTTNTNSLITPNMVTNIPRYKVQVGVFASEDNVNKLRSQLQPFGSVNVIEHISDTRKLSSVSVGPYENIQKAQETIDALGRMGINGADIISD